MVYFNDRMLPCGGIDLGSIPSASDSPQDFLIFLVGVGGYLFFELWKSGSAGLRMQCGVSRYRVCFLFLFFP